MNILLKMIWNDDDYYDFDDGDDDDGDYYDVDDDLFASDAVAEGANPNHRGALPDC